MRTLTKKLIIILFMAALFYSCKKEKCNDCYTGTLEEVTGAYCGNFWQISLNQPDKDNNYKIRAMNIEDFDVTLRNGQVVELKFIDESLITPCQDGKYVNLKSIRDM